MVDGQPGKGDKYRPVDQKKWEENWAKAFPSKNSTKKKRPGGVHPGGIGDISDIEERDTNNE